MAALRDLYHDLGRAPDDDPREDAPPPPGGADAPLSPELADLWARVESLAEGVLADTVRIPVGLGLAARHWRARRLGPAAAAADLTSAREGGFVHRYWDEEGRLRPLEEGPCFD